MLNKSESRTLKMDEIAFLSNQQDKRLSDKRILPSPPKSVRGECKILRSRILKDCIMENEEENRERKITTRFKPGEFILIDRRFRKTRFRKMSEYIRCVLLEKPLTIIYRDKSMDDMLEELALLRRELTAIGNNLNQAVRQINAAHGDADNRLWLSLMSIISSKVDPAIAQIKDRMQNFSEIWSQKSKPDEASSEQ
ncbi:hypothetical protein QE417_000128 [Mucilaginibacter terrae]|uniref:Plasmid mobilization relaxosome protein MobC n=2 Tax=Mucilaginibacter terrae TaxID=1955052 RepID=A0ABU3GMP9_9SPHI|nr:hypothetical protein [Mucilaginibacter terrae]